MDGTYNANMKRVVLFEEDDNWLMDSLSDDGLCLQKSHQHSVALKNVQVFHVDVKQTLICLQIQVRQHSLMIWVCSMIFCVSQFLGYFTSYLRFAIEFLYVQMKITKITSQ